MRWGGQGTACRSQGESILPRPGGPRSSNSSPATYMMRERKQKEWKGGPRQREKQQGQRLEGAHSNPACLEMQPGRGTTRDNAGEPCKSFQPWGRVGGRVSEQLPSHSARARRGRKDTCLHEGHSGAPLPWEGSPGPARVFFPIQCTCQDAGWWKRTVKQPGAEVEESKDVRGPREEQGDNRQ